MNTIAVIDDGVSQQSLCNLIFDLMVDDNLQITNCDENKIDNISHGTICAFIIRKYAPDASIGSIKILDTTTNTGIFVSNDYNTIFVLTETSEDMDNALYLPKERLLKSSIIYLEDKVETDLIIIGLQESDLTEKTQINCDILFDETDNKSNLCRIEYEERIAFSSRDANIGNILYQKALKMMI